MHNLFRTSETWLKEWSYFCSFGATKLSSFPTRISTWSISWSPAFSRAWRRIREFGNGFDRALLYRYPYDVHNLRGTFFFTLKRPQSSSWNTRQGACLARGNRKGRSPSGFLSYPSPFVAYCVKFGEVGWERQFFSYVSDTAGLRWNKALQNSKLTKPTL